jgi:DNA-binding HxlR family transcriptional regulator
MSRDSAASAAKTRLESRRLRSLLQSGEAAVALRLLGDRWVLLILRDAFLGVRRFEQMQRQSGAPRSTLTARLATLVDAGILYRHEYAIRPRRLEYRLTEKGFACYPIALVLWSWEQRWGDPASLPPTLLHVPCGRATQPNFICDQCRKPVHHGDVRYQLGALRRRGAPPLETRRREARAGRGADATLFHALEIIGDRWSALTLASLYLGNRRYDALIASLGIASNILADRLRRLLTAGIVEQIQYHAHPPRHEYRLTAKGWGLQPFALTLQEWARTWLPARDGPALELRHATCGHRLRTRAVCSHCCEVLQPQAVTLRQSAAPRRLRPKGAT